VLALGALPATHVVTVEVGGTMVDLVIDERSAVVLAALADYPSQPMRA
jgi:hypothetical protein